jgi:hypothetical protein
MEIKDLTTNLERKLYVEIIGERNGLISYFETTEALEETATSKRLKIRLELLTELSKIIEDEKYNK